MHSTTRVEEHTFDSGTTLQIGNNGLVFSSQPHNTINYERADSQIKISQKSTRIHVLQVIANLSSVYHSYHHGEVIHPDSVYHSYHHGEVIHPDFVDGIDQPVAFVSKSLSKSQLRWSVIHRLILIRGFLVFTQKVVKMVMKYSKTHHIRRRLQQPNLIFSYSNFYRRQPLSAFHAPCPCTA